MSNSPYVYERVFCAFVFLLARFRRSAAVRWAMLAAAMCACAPVPAAYAQTVHFSVVQTLGGGFNQDNSVAVDGSGNVYVADYDNSAVKVMPPGCTSSSCVTTLGGGFFYPEGANVDGNGNVYVADAGKSAVKEIMTGAVALPTTALGQSSQGPVLTFTFDTGGEIAAPAVLTEGATGLDLADAGPGTCTTNGSAHTSARATHVRCSSRFRRRHRDCGAVRWS